MDELPFKKFIDLVTFDQQIFAFQREIKQLEQELDEVKQQLELLDDEIQISKTHFLATKREVDAKELEMETFSSAEKEIRKKIDALQNPKEYSPLKKELEHIREKQHQFETVLVQAWQAMEVAERDYKARQAIYEEKAHNTQAAIDEKSKKIIEIQRRIDALAEERKTKMEGVPQEWLEKYRMMQSRISNPIVPVINDSCGACFYKILSNDLMLLRKRALVQCKDCYRFLYMPTAMESASKGE